MFKFWFVVSVWCPFRCASVCGEPSSSARMLRDVVFLVWVLVMVEFQELTTRGRPPLGETIPFFCNVFWGRCFDHGTSCTCGSACVAGLQMMLQRCKVCSLSLGLLSSYAVLSGVSSSVKNCLPVWALRDVFFWASVLAMAQFRIRGAVFL